MKWIEPKYPRKKVKKAGDYLVKADIDSTEFKESIPVFHNWRSAHAFPMQIMLDLLRKNSIRIDRGAIAVQRLKRVPSIYTKLVREKGMSLSRMEDIAGCRVVVDNVRYVNKVYSLLKKSRTKNILHRERDYITAPKESGYRGVHLIFKYNGSKEKYHGMAVELQIRSKIQHSWATAVEVVGAYTKQALKASSGDTMWLDAFKYISAEFSKLEGCPVDGRFNGIDTFHLMAKHINELNMLERLTAFKVATRALTQDKEHGAGYFIVLLDLDERLVSYSRFGKSQLDEATSFYDEQESLHKDSPSKDVVMVSAASVRDLKRAYPNYFADTAVFERYLAKVYEANK
ncbi:MAG: RelA/SpoT domain-containing protein [Candidatus Thiodiazotropha sp. (ex Codakia orbicularis)]|nr:RelA/SpoT domain-containing protein [Candidatus Thiodiazotropha sp. (ex Codakia orbicularis)]